MPTKANYIVALLLALLLCASQYAHSKTAQSDSSVAVQNNTSSESLHRLDFRMEGKSCPVCLLSIQNKIKAQPGVQEAVVMLKRPFGVSVIYRAGEITSDQILAVIKAKEPIIKILEINDTPVNTVPSPLIPPYLPATAPNSVLPNNAFPTHTTNP